MRIGPGASSSCFATKEIKKLERLPLIEGTAGESAELEREFQNAGRGCVIAFPLAVAGYVLLIGTAGAIFYGCQLALERIHDYDTARLEVR